MSEKENKLYSFEHLKEHKSNLTTVRKWDQYAKENNLPSSVSLINHFGTWNNAKKEFGIQGHTMKKYDKESLLAIAKEHQDHFTSKRTWNAYAKTNGLPRESTYIKTFGSWDYVKELLDMEPISPIRPPKYDKSDIESILKEHGKNLENRTQWDKYAKKHSLPTYKTLRKHYTWNEILKLSGVDKKLNYTRDELIQIGIKHYSQFIVASINKWNEYAREHSLPSSYAFLRNFDTWKNAKVELVKHINKNKH